MGEKPLPNNDSFDLEVLVSKCKEESYREEHEEQCKVVEDLDETIENIETEKQSEDEGETNSPSQPGQNSIFDDPSRQKADIVQSIERQTTKKNDEKKKKKKKKKNKTKKKNMRSNARWWRIWMRQLKILKRRNNQKMREKPTLLHSQSRILSSMIRQGKKQ